MNLDRVAEIAVGFSKRWSDSNALLQIKYGLREVSELEVYASKHEKIIRAICVLCAKTT